MSGQPLVGFCAALSPSWPHPARLRGAVLQPPLLGALGTCCGHVEIQKIEFKALSLNQAAVL